MILLGFISLFLSCSSDLKKHSKERDSLLTSTNEYSKMIEYDFSITEYHCVDSDYYKSNEVIYYSSKKYSPVICSYYKNDTLIKFDLFGTEGRIQYDPSDLQNDTLFAKTLNVEQVRNIRCLDSVIIDSGRKFRTKVLGNLIFYFIDESLCVCCPALQHPIKIKNDRKQNRKPIKKN